MFKKIVFALALAIAPFTATYAQECTTPKDLTAAAEEAGAQEFMHITGKDVSVLRQVLAQIAGTTEDEIVPFDEVKIYYKDDATTILFALFVEGCLKVPAFLPPEQAAVIIQAYRKLKVADGQ